MAEQTMVDPETGQGDSGLRSIDRAAAVLQSFLFRSEWSLADLTRQVNLPKSVVYRLLSALSASGLVVDDGGTYRLGALILRLAEQASYSKELVALARPFLRELCELTRETVTLCEVRKGRGFCLDFAESTQAMRMTVYRGETFPLNAGAIGKALLAFQAEEVIAEVLRGELPRFTPDTIVDPAQLRSELTRIRQRGYADSEGEITPGARSVGVPLRSPNGAVIASLSVSAPNFRMDAERIAAAIAALLDAADRLTAALRLQHHDGDPPRMRVKTDALQS